MDADNRIIPIVEWDQGEGIKDPLDIDDLIKKGAYKKANFKADQIFQKLMHKQQKEFHRQRR